MPGQTTCPIADVDRALSAYVNTREDTLRIRRTISRYLTSSLRPVNPATQNQHLNHQIPFGLSATNTNPPGLKDRRLEYLQALRAQNQAQSKHQELQASLQDLQNQHVEETLSKSAPEYDNESTQSHVSLLRQRRRFAELQVIQDSLDKLLMVKPSNALTDSKATVKDVLGEQPDLPAERIEQLSGTQDDQAYVFKLKQEVLEAKASMERAQDARVQAQAQAKLKPPPSLQTQIQALEHARDELVEWVQCELAKLEEESLFLEDASPMKRPTKNPAEPIDLASAESRIKDAYTNYTVARATLLDAYQSLQHPPSPPPSPSPSPSPSSSPSPQTKQQQQLPNLPTQPTHPYTSLTPHLPPLTTTATQSRTLLTHSLHQTAHLASTLQTLHTALTRLAAESHMLPADATHAAAKDASESVNANDNDNDNDSVSVSAWGRTARDAEAATEAVVRKCVAESRREGGAVDAVVELCSLQTRVVGVGAGTEAR